MSENLPREVSVETRPCGTCGTPLAVQENGDGSTSTTLCEKCFPAKQTAAAITTTEAREKGTDTEEEVPDGE